MLNRSSAFENTHAIVRLGYEDYARNLIEETLLALRRDELNDSQRIYLVDCLQRTLDGGDANKGFYLKSNKGKKRKAVALRDFHAAAQVIYWTNKGLKHADALEKEKTAINKMFREAPVDIKAIEAAHSQHRKKVMKDWEEIEPVLKGVLD